MSNRKASPVNGNESLLKEYFKTPLQLYHITINKSTDLLKSGFLRYKIFKRLEKAAFHEESDADAHTEDGEGH